MKGELPVVRFMAMPREPNIPMVSIRILGLHWGYSAIMENEMESLFRV